MIVHLHLLSVFKHLRHLPIPTLLFVTPILLKWVHVSYKKPTLHLPPSTSRITSLVTATPSLNRPHLPHPMTAFPAFSPLLRGLSTTSFLSAYMSSLSMLNPFTVIALILGTHKLDTVEKIIIPADSGVVSLVWSSTAPPASLNQPIILLLPGMGNSSETGFVRRLSRLLSSTTPFTVSTMDYRHVGHSSSFPSPSSRPCCADSYRDIEHVITYIHAKYVRKSEASAQIDNGKQASDASLSHLRACLICEPVSLASMSPLRACLICEHSSFASIPPLRAFLLCLHVSFACMPHLLASFANMPNFLTLPLASLTTLARANFLTLPLASLPQPSLAPMS